MVSIRLVWWMCLRGRAEKEEEHRGLSVNTMEQKNVWPLIMSQTVWGCLVFYIRSLRREEKEEGGRKFNLHSIILIWFNNTSTFGPIWQLLLPHQHAERALPEIWCEKHTMASCGRFPPLKNMNVFLTDTPKSFVTADCRRGKSHMHDVLT